MYGSQARISWWNYTNENLNISKVQAFYCQNGQICNKVATKTKPELGSICKTVELLKIQSQSER